MKKYMLNNLGKDWIFEGKTEEQVRRNYILDLISLDYIPMGYLEHAYREYCYDVDVNPNLEFVEVK